MPDDDAHCDGCGAVMPAGTPSYPCSEGGYLCKSCSPTYQDLLDHPDLFMNADDAPMSAAEAKAIADAHVAAGGALADSMAL